MKLIIILFAILIIAVTLLLIIRPSMVMDRMVEHAESAWLHFLAVAVRLILGGVLISYASQSKFPLTLQVIGGISIAAAVVFAILPHQRFARLIRWAFDRLGNYTRVAAVFGLLLAGFLIYAVL